MGHDRREPPPAEEIRPKRCPACGVASAPTGDGLNLHAHSKHRMRGIRGLIEPPEPGDLLEGGGLETVDTRIAVRRYFCVDCKTTCTVLPAEVRVHADILRPTVALALAVWALHPDRPSAEVIKHWLFPDRRSHVGGWPQLRRWAHSTAELVGPDEILTDGTLPKKRVAQIIQICRARGPPGLRDGTRWSRIYLGATHPQ